MATDKYYSPGNYVTCFNNTVLEELINRATKNPDAGEKMLEWFKEKRANLIANYNGLQVFFKPVLNCENVERDLQFNSEATKPEQIRQIALGLKHILCQVKGEIKVLLFTPNLKINDNDIKKIALQKRAKKRKGNPDNYEKFLKKARPDGEEINKTEGQESATQQRVLKQLLSLDKQKTNLTDENTELTKSATELENILSGLMDDIKAKNKEIEEAEKMLANKGDELKKVNDDITEKQADLEKVERDTKTAEDNLGRTNKKIEEAEEMVTEKRDELKKVNDDITEKQADLEKVERETKIAGDNLDRTNKKIEEAEKMVTGKGNELEKINDKISKKQADLERIKGETKSAKANLKKANKKRAGVERKLTNKTTELKYLLEYIKDRRNLLKYVEIEITEIGVKSNKLSELFKEDLTNTMSTPDRETLLTKIDDQPSGFNNKRKRRTRTQNKKGKINTQAQEGELLLNSSVDEHETLSIDE